MIPYLRQKPVFQAGFNKNKVDPRFQRLWDDAICMMPLWDLATDIFWFSRGPLDYANPSRSVEESAGMTWQSGPLGKGATTDETIEEIELGELTEISGGATPFTVVVAFSRGDHAFSFEGGDEALYSLNHSVSNQGGPSLYMEDGDGSLKVAEDTDGAAVTGSTTGLNDGKPHVATLTYDPQGGGQGSHDDMTLYVDGQNDTASTTNGFNNLRAGNPALLCHSILGEERIWTGELYCFYVWKRVLSLAEIRILSQNPFAPFTPRHPIYLLEAVAAAPAGPRRIFNIS